MYSKKSLLRHVIHASFWFLSKSGSPFRVFQQSELSLLPRFINGERGLWLDDCEVQSRFPRNPTPVSLQSLKGIASASRVEHLSAVSPILNGVADPWRPKK